VTPYDHTALADKYKNDGMKASTPQKLVVLMFERIGIDLHRAAAAIEIGHHEKAHRSLINAQDILFELQIALDHDVWDGAEQLQQIYNYLLGLLVEANIKKSGDLVAQCITIVEPLIETWREAYRLIQSGETTPVSPPAPITATTVAATTVANRRPVGAASGAMPYPPQS